MKIRETFPDLCPVMTRTSKIVSHSNEKGGVGKSTITFNQACRLAEQGRRVLILDYDGQRNMTKTLFGGNMSLVEKAEKVAFTTADLFSPNTKIEEVRVCESPLSPNIHFIPSHKAKIAEVMNSGADKAKLLIENPKKFIYQLDYDYILIDTPPSLGITQLSAIATVDLIFIPVTIDDYSNEGLESLLKTMQGIKRSLKAKVELGGIYINNFEKPARRMGENPEEELLENLKKDYGEWLIEPYIPRSKNIKEARMKGLPAWVKAPNGNAALVGRKLRNAIDSINDRINKRMK
ncbi:ParA family protein [Vibrio rotiferianus]|uniref:ParA family protein n=1 Tax=Vibrio rotiferianus TaxID=190895 RepID=UPI0005F023E9|nr:ParA family protein [Vibrio rotiferianus]